MHMFMCMYIYIYIYIYSVPLISVYAIQVSWLSHTKAAQVVTLGVSRETFRLCLTVA